jgi:hypothetical protein
VLWIADLLHQTPARCMTIEVAMQSDSDLFCMQHLSIICLSKYLRPLSVFSVFSWSDLGSDTFLVRRKYFQSVMTSENEQEG